MKTTQNIEIEHTYIVPLLNGPSTSKAFYTAIITHDNTIRQKIGGFHYHLKTPTTCFFSHH